MTRPADWNTDVLNQPVILDVPDPLPADPDPLVTTAARALAAQQSGAHQRASRLVATLGHAGVVAVRTTDAALEVRELLDGWKLVGRVGDPDAPTLAAAAKLRAARLARERHTTPGLDRP
jgi:hypothetical protein